MKNRLLSILLVLLMALTFLPLGAWAEGDNKCGEYLTWNLDEIGILTISGTGDMYNYSSAYPAPWNEHCLEITNVTISDGVTSIGDNAFHSCKALSIAVAHLPDAKHLETLTFRIASKPSAQMRFPIATISLMLQSPTVFNP